MWTTYRAQVGVVQRGSVLIRPGQSPTSIADSKEVNTSASAPVSIPYLI